MSFTNCQICVIMISCLGVWYLKDFIEKYILESISTKERLLKDPILIAEIEKASLSIIEAYKKGGKVLTAGNGGSAADAQHIAAEFVSKFMYNRKALNAIALTTNSSILTSVGNDYSHEHVFARQIQAYGNRDDIFIAISTSGNSKNIILAINEAKNQGLKIIGFTGGKPSEMDKLCNHLIKIPSEKTPIIQESHIMVGHIICALVEKEFLVN